MALIDELVDPAVHAELEAVEEQAEAEVEAAVDEQAAALGLTAAALVAAAPAVVAAVSAAVLAAVPLGARIALGAARPQRPRRGGRLPAPGAVDVRGAVRDAVRGGVEALRDAPEEQRPVVFGRARDWFGVTARDVTQRGASAGAQAAARRAGAAGLLWVAERDACLQCARYSGETSPTGAFRAGLSFDRAYVWTSFSGQPPLHPNCRCVLVLYWPGSTLPGALRREARAAVLAHASTSASHAAATRAAARLGRTAA
ncbi:hypothetical protein [Allonocardiopsis opalescens]|uniref:SPP1 gp7 family phage head morphogenesis protein n=1 Tax=Allonocardiopsis opalescens TaxID=1144618 RepID=A0A2T0PTF0_9ACTN|nr:hypothetical protein [Allonocardiopsis opalescens]PRX91996.1 hypothetical protein CLV72_11269 [Allonocardiopsis opalescens]